MKVSRLLLYIGFAILGFWLLGLAIKLAAWVIQLVLVIGLVLVILGLINEYYESHKTKK